MARRLNIAAGLRHHPDLLILDEPTVGDDPQSRNSILEHVETLNAAGMAVLYTTHYMEEAERLCDRVGIMDEGRLIAEGTRRELVESTREEDRIHLTFDAGTDLVAMAALAGIVEGVSSAAPSEGGVQVLAAQAQPLLPRLVESFVDAGHLIAGVEVAEPNLESVFLGLTGRALRD